MTRIADQFAAAAPKSLADQFDEAAAKVAPSAPKSLADQFDAAAAMSPAAAAPAAAPAHSTLDELGRQIGLTGRAAVTGVTALPAMLGDALNSGINYGIRGVNSLAGTHVPELQMPSQVTQRGMDAIGVPQPANATERVVQDIASSMAGVSPSVAAGKLLMRASAPVAQAVGAGLQTAPGMQIAAATGAGAGSGGSRELGLGPGWQIGAALLGGAAGVGTASATTAGVRALTHRFGPQPSISPAAAAARADSGVDQVVSELGPQMRQSYGAPDGGLFGNFEPIKQQVARVIEQTPNVDPAAVMRSQDFRALGMDPTLGQITRDPTQFAREMNIRGMSTGSPLANRFNQQNTQLQQALNGLAGTASDAYTAGSAIRNSLRSIDEQMGQQVSDAYAAARASSGKNLDVPLTGIAQDYAATLKNFGDKVPSGVRNNFNELGLMSGTQRKTFSVEDAESLLKVINANASNDPATNTALGQLRKSVKNAILSADDQGGVYAPARQLAAQRFALQDQVPALRAAASDAVAPDDFVRKFVIGGKTDEVNAMADLLRQHAPDTLGEMRNQVGAQLVAKGFGVNPAGDAKFNPSTFMGQLQAFGPTKLGALYTPEEVAQLNTIGRVGAYMNAFPAASPVNTSNTASAIGSLLQHGVKEVPVVGKLINSMGDRMFVNRALAASLANTTAQPSVSPAQRALGALLLNTAPRAPRAPGGNP